MQDTFRAFGGMLIYFPLCLLAMFLSFPSFNRRSPRIAWFAIIVISFLTARFDGMDGNSLLYGLAATVVVGLFIRTFVAKQKQNEDK